MSRLTSIQPFRLTALCLVLTTSAAAGDVILQTGFESASDLSMLPGSRLDDEYAMVGTHSLLSEPEHRWLSFLSPTSFYTGPDNKTGATIAPDPRWNIAPDASSSFAISYWYMPSDPDRVYDVLTNANGTDKVGWCTRHNGPGLQFAWFDPSGEHRTIDAEDVGWRVDHWHRVVWSRSASGRFTASIDGRIVIDTDQKIVIAPSPYRLKINMVRQAAGRIDDLRIETGD